MPREIVTLQVGQCGNQMGSAFWNLLLQEMKANAATDDATSSMFYTEQHPRKQLKARCIPIDTEEGGAICYAAGAPPRALRRCALHQRR